ncbi:CPBP family intramembrane glutamic endopeptidase [Priestia megaterium]|uniref:CPBP family intramembrane glutamic endopeptidase n=1 Tax=Priestia megaterium TaxID=1404 RepID=UPI0020A0F34F|nr:type II CAAX endopeptidase family protein [Priestia megaterium]MCP1452399.1 membrane protease YdiL (CAAX protease family) [Priestia megaterium]
MRIIKKNKPIFVSILWALLILVFYVAGGVITQVLKINEINSLLVNGVCVWLSVLIAVLYIWKSNYHFGDMGFRSIEKKSKNKILFYFPIILVEIVGFIVGIRHVSVEYLLSVVFFTVAVGFAEEIYFRSLILKTLEGKGVKKAIIISSVIFGITHLGNLVGGANIPYTIIQVVFAFAFGIVFAEIFYLTKSLIPVILWHFLHDTFGYIQKQPDIHGTILFAGIQTVILVAYALYMWKMIKNGKEKIINYEYNG